MFAIKSPVALYLVCALLALLSFAAGADDGSESPTSKLATFLQYASAVIASASVIAAMTPTPKDDGVLLVARKLVDFLSLNIGGAKTAASVDKHKRLK